MWWPKFIVKKLSPNNDQAIYIMREILRRTRMRDFICWTGIKPILPKSPRKGLPYNDKVDRTGNMASDINKEIQMREKKMQIMPAEGPSVQERMNSDNERLMAFLTTDFPERPTNDHDLVLYKKAMRMRYYFNFNGMGYNFVDEEIKKEMEMLQKESQIKREMQTWTGIMRHPIRCVKGLFKN